MPSPLAVAMSRGGRIHALDRYQKLMVKLNNNRSTFDSWWQDISDVIMPTRTRFFTTERNQAGATRANNIYDNTGRIAQRTLAAGMHSGLTSPARPWMKLSTPDPDLAEHGPVKEWLHVTTQRMLAVFQQSNLYNVLPTLYGDYGGFGTGAIGCLEDQKDLLRFYSYPLGSFSLGMDTRRQVSTFAYEYELSVRQVVEEFALQENGTIDETKLSANVRSRWANGDYEDAVPVCWIVLPNDDYRPDNPLSQFKRFISLHFEKGNTGENATFLRIAGFDTFPVMAPRWDATGNDTYGTDCPGMTALGDVKQLQIEQRRKGQLLSKALDPPLKGPSSLRNRKISLLPGDFTADDVRTGQQGLQPIHEVRLEGFQHVSLDIAEVQYRIKRAFFEDLFLMLHQPDPNRGKQPLTAQEVAERHEEKLVMLGPVLERTNDELLEPLVDRTYGIMDRYGLVPPPPPALDGVKLRVEFTSILHQAQKLVGVSGQDGFVERVLGMAERAAVIDPQVAASVLAKVDWMQSVDNYGEMLGIDPRTLKSTEEVMKFIAEQREAQQAAASAEQAGMMAKAAKDASQADLGDGRNALQAVTQTA